MHLGQWFQTRDDFCLPGDVWQNLETCLIVTTPGEGATGIYWVEARDAGEHPTIDTGRPSQQRIKHNVSKLRNPNLGLVRWTWAGELVRKVWGHCAKC